MKLLTLARDLGRRKAREKHSLCCRRRPLGGGAAPLRPQGSGRAGRSAASLRTSRQALRKGLDESGVEVAEVSEKDFRSAAETESPQGVIAIGEVPERSLDTLDVAGVCRLIVLDGVQDPGNAGTIVRTAAALGATATIALPGTVDLWNPKVIRSSMGAQFQHQAFHAGIDDLLSFLAAKKIDLWAADAGGSPLENGRAPVRLAIAVGNEGSGLSPAIRAKAQRIVSLPIARNVESLNVAVATGIILYQLRS